MADVGWAGTLPDEAIKDPQQIKGRGVIETIYKGEPIVNHRLAPKGAGAGLAATIPVGMRAAALRVNDVVGLAGFVLPGMRVDVLVAGAAPGSDTGRTGMLCRTVLQNIEVLSAGQRIEKNEDGKPESAQVVNLLVSPDEAETLNLASSETKVQLVLRNPLDTNAAVTHGTTVAALFGVTLTKPVIAMNSPPRLAPAQSATLPRKLRLRCLAGLSAVKQELTHPTEQTDESPV